MLFNSVCCDAIDCVAMSITLFDGNIVEFSIIGGECSVFG